LKNSFLKEGVFFALISAGGEVNPDRAQQQSGTPALGTQNPFRSDFEGVFAFFGKLLANISENQISVP